MKNPRLSDELEERIVLIDVDGRHRFPVVGYELDGSKGLVIGTGESGDYVIVPEIRDALQRVLHHDKVIEARRKDQSRNEATGVRVPGKSIASYWLSPELRPLVEPPQVKFLERLPAELGGKAVDSQSASAGSRPSFDTASLREQLRPRKLNRVRDLVAEAGIDVASWFLDRNGEPIDNNIYRNFQWSFGGGGEPVALCIWHEEIDWDRTPPVQTGNTRSQQEELNALADKAATPGVKSRLGIKVRRTRDFQNALYNAKSHDLAVRVILLDGQRTDIVDAADDSSRVRARELDPMPWYVHECDPVTGSYRLVRGQKPPPTLTRDPFEGSVDPGLDPTFQDFVATLPETEREAMIRARVGQGGFRGALIARWQGCSVTACATFDILVASHIKPWSKCLTPAERLGTANGLLLTPNLDKPFDNGLLTFDERYRIRLSTRLKPGAAITLNVDKNLRLTSKGAGTDLLPFLAWHGEHVFRH